MIATVPFVRPTMPVFLLAALVGSAPPTVAAQSPAAPPPSSTGSTAALDLAQALQIARSSAPGLRMADARRDVAAGRGREPGQFTNPTVEYRRENLGSTLSPDIFTTLFVPFDVTGRRLALRKAGTEALTRADADRIADRREAEVQVARVWLRAAAAQEQLLVVQAQAAAWAEVARIDAVRFREGGVAEGVAIRTRLEADRAKVAVATAVGELARARSELARTLGVSDRTLPILAALTAPSLPVPPDSTTAVALAVQARPELAAREAAVREAEARLAAEQRGILGDWQLQGGSKKTAGVMTGQLGLAMPLPLFNRNDGARQRVRGELGEVTASRDDAGLAVRGEAIATLTNYLAVQATAADAATFAQRGLEIATISRTAYREGHASLVELLDAERASADALTARIRWTVEAWMARLELERALGVRLDADGLLDLPLRAALSSTSR